MGPACENFITGHAAILQVHQGLEVGCDLVIADGGRELAFEHRALADEVVHTGLEEGEPAAMGILGATQGEAGAMQKRFGIAAIHETDRSAGRGADR